MNTSTFITELEKEIKGVDFFEQEQNSFEYQVGSSGAWLDVNIETSCDMYGVEGGDWDEVVCEVENKSVTIDLVLWDVNGEEVEVSQELRTKVESLIN